MSVASCHLLRCALGVLLAAVMMSGPAYACQVCIPVPEKTAADHVIAADAVVLARENPERRFTFLTVEVLKGDTDQPEIDLFVNSATRRWLASGPDRTVMLIRNDDDPSGRQWRTLGLATPRYEALMREVLTRSDQWRGGPEAQTRRAAFFMPYLDTDEPALHDLAYLEVGRAPYGVLRHADRHVRPERVQAFLGSLQYFEWQNLYILLLGVNATDTEKAEIRATMTSRAETGSDLHLAPGATALIEIDGADGVGWLERKYLGPGAADPALAAEIVKALSVHGSLGPGALRQRIVEAYGLVLAHHPELAGPLARDLAVWRDWSLAETLSRLREAGLVADGAAAYSVDYYLGLAATD